MAASTRASGTRDHLLRVVAEVAQHHRRRVTAGHARHRAAHARRAARLVEPRDRHAVDGPARYWPVLRAEGVAAVAAVEGAPDHVLVRALDVRRALDVVGQDVLVRERRDEAPHVLELAPEDRLLVLLPAGDALRQVPGLRAEQLDRVM